MFTKPYREPFVVPEILPDVGNKPPVTRQNPSSMLG
jgi:hypothetical protein